MNNGNLILGFTVMMATAGAFVYDNIFFLLAAVVAIFTIGVEK